MSFLKTMRASAVFAMLAVVLAACSEGPTAPQSPTFDPSGPLLAKGGGTSGGSGRGLAAGSRVFTIWPGAPVFEKFGDHVLYVPANVTCDPETSDYGSALWDAPCALASAPIRVTAAWSTVNGRPTISFSPDLRFAPSKHEKDWVQLSLNASKSIDPERYYAILWFDKQAGQWVDESQSDPTLKARIYLNGNLVTRRLKHFSEYALWSGFGSYNVTSGFGGDW